MKLTHYEVRAYTKTGMYSAYVQAANTTEALKLGKKEIAECKPVNRVRNYVVFTLS